MNILIVGSGGREHALMWALSRSPLVNRVYVAPGNAGTSENVPIPADDVSGLLAFARQNRIEMTVVGPEAPLAAGIVDIFHDAGLKIFGPSKAAAQLEVSKAFAKSFMLEYGIPTAKYETFTDYEAALRFLSTFEGAVVVKADGLAAGKGVFVCDTPDDARGALKQIMLDHAFGEAGEVVVIEERLTGPEVSILAFTDGKTLRMMPPARDHKRAYDHDQGPNTGGMGAYAPAPDVRVELLEQIRHLVLQPAVDGMAARGTPYVGILYAGLMLTTEGPKVLEFNCRLGDPETQALLPLLETDLAQVFPACVEGRLIDIDVAWRAGACATVVAASPGYPGDYPRQLPISGIDSMDDEEAMVFHAGTAFHQGHLVTSGGRVLAVSALGHDLTAAIGRAYAHLERIYFDGMHFRRDIGR